MSNNAQWALIQNIDIENRMLIVELGIVDSFGEFHTEESKQYQHRDWITLTDEQFVIAAELQIAKSKELTKHLKLETVM